MNAAFLILVAIVVAPIIILLILRINATLVFLSLCLGSVLTHFLSGDAGFVMSLSSKNVPAAGSVTDSTIKLALLLLPAALTALFMIRTVHGRGKLFLNLLPSAGVGFLGGLLAVPLLPASAAATLMSSPLWTRATKLQDLIVGSSALLCLFVLWLQRPKTGDHDKHSK